LTVETHLRLGDYVQQLVDIADGARLLVLGNRSPRSLDRIWTGETVTGVADRAACPVIVVPADYVPDDVHGRLVVAVQSPATAMELFDPVFPLADELGAELVVLHAWDLQGVYDDVIADRMVAERNQERTELIEKELLHYREAFPRVPVRLYVRHEDPAHALVRVTSGADRLLLLRPASRGVAPQVGRIARAVLRDSRCPVEVVPSRTGGASALRTVRHAELVP
jgi:nucleotide-binding universal stress UspA family protein